MNGVETYNLFSTIIRNYQIQKPLEYKQLLLNCPSLKIHLNDDNKRFLVKRSSSVYIRNEETYGTRLYLCGVPYEFVEQFKKDKTRIEYYCVNDLYRQRSLEEYNIASDEYRDCCINRSFIKLIVCELFGMIHTSNYRTLSFPNPFHKGT